MVNSLKELFAYKAGTDMVVISDVDGVHTTRAGGVRIGTRPSQEGTVIEVHDGLEVLHLVPANPNLRNIEIILGGFVGQDVWEFYRFHTPDGQSVQNLLRAGVRTIITSGREAAPVRDRFGRTLKFEDGAVIRRPEVHLGVKDKYRYFTEMKTEMKIDFSKVVVISDGDQDAALLRAVRDAGGVAVAPADAEPEAASAAHMLTQARGGEGAFAEMVQAFLEAHTSSKK